MGNVNRNAWIPCLGALALLGLGIAPVRAELSIEPTADPAAMVNALISRGIIVKSVTYEAGEAAGWHYYPFTNGLQDWNEGGEGPSAIFRKGPLGIGDGLLLTTGNVGLVLPPNVSLPKDFREDGSTEAEGATGILSPDRGPAVGGNPAEPFCSSLIDHPGIEPHDVVKLTIDFELEEKYQGIELDYIFGSEEYPDFQGDRYPDAFGFFVRPHGESEHTNFGLDPEQQNITINGPFFASDSVITTYGPNANAKDLTEYNGMTPKLRSGFYLESGPGKRHQIVIVICDAGDQWLDSGVFLHALAGCEQDCDSTTWCGDGVLQAGEECDDGNAQNGDGCDVECRLETCGNGQVDPPFEECDEGGEDTTGACPRCKWATCHDGYHQVGVETGVDCGGPCGPCVAGDPCFDASDCESNYCLCPGGEDENGDCREHGEGPALGTCMDAPQPIARDDHMNALSGEESFISLSEILSNDLNIANESFALEGLQSLHHGSVRRGQKDGVDGVFYRSSAGYGGTDIFNYRVCSSFQMQECVTGQVLVNVNRPPLVGDIESWTAVGEESLAILLTGASGLFNDPDGDLIDFEASTWDVEGGSLHVNADSFVFVPDEPESPRIYEVALRFCDNAPVQGCADGSWTIVYNDPPELHGEAVVLPLGGQKVFSFSEWFLGFGAIEGRLTPTSTGLVRLALGTSEEGPFTGNQLNFLHGICVLNPGTLALSFTASSQATRMGESVCWLRACEERPSMDTRVCTVVPFPFKVQECAGGIGCSAGNVCDEAAGCCSSCVPGDEGEIAVGCTLDAPYCLSEESWTCAGDEGLGIGLRSCKKCIDLGAGMLDQGCTEELQACHTFSDTVSECVECDHDLDCNGDEFCDLDVFQCVRCKDTAPGAELDEGCTLSHPICAEGTCVSCLDDAPESSVDTGCHAELPYCEGATPETKECGGCTDVCPDNGTCFEGKCIICEDTAPGAELDEGCIEVAPICDLSLAPRDCVTCIDDRPGLQVDLGCSRDNPMCRDRDPNDGSGLLRHCVSCERDLDCPEGRRCRDGACKECYVDESLEIDPGCSSDLPVCEDNCVVCSPDSGNSIDRGCSVAKPFCKEDPTTHSRRCWGCQSDADCPQNEICDEECVEVEVPQAIDDAYRTNQGVTLLVPASLGLQVNDRIPGNQVASVAVISGTRPDPTTEGLLEVNGDGALSFQPVASFYGVVSFNYRLTVGTFEPSEALVTITVNGAPIAEDDEVILPSRQTTPIDVLRNDSDPEDDPITVTAIVKEPSHGTVEIEGGVVYTPDPDFEGEDEFEYEVCDDQGACDTARVTVTVGEDTRIRLGLDDEARTLQNVPVLINVTENDDDGLVFQDVASQPYFGHAKAIGEDVLYTPKPYFTGMDVFTYRTCEDAQCVDLNVRVEVIPVNHPPIARNDYVRADGLVNIRVLDNDNDPDGDSLSPPRLLVPPEFGDAEANGRAIRYRPKEGFKGQVSFKYETCDPYELCDQAIVVVEVGKDNAPPEARNDAVTVRPQEEVEIPVLSNDSDPDGDPLHVSEICTPKHGEARIEDGQIVYEAYVLEAAEDRFCYVVCDESLCDTAYVVVTIVAPENLPPVAIDDLASTRSGVPVELLPLENDFDPEGEEIRLLFLGTPNVGDLRQVGDKVIYTPPADFVGTAEFLVRIEDPHGLRDESWAVILVSDAWNEPPFAEDDFYKVNLSERHSLDILNNDSDPDGDPLNIVWVDYPSERHGRPFGSLAWDRNGVEFIPPNLEEAAKLIPLLPITFAYQITDGRGGFDDALVTLDLEDKNRNGIPDELEPLIPKEDLSNVDESESDYTGLVASGSGGSGCQSTAPVGGGFFLLLAALGIFAFSSRRKGHGF